MELNLPPRLLRVVAGCFVITVLLISTYVYLARDYTSTPLSLPSPWTDNATLIEEPEPFVPGWTTEQLEPKFAYAQYATTMDYLCNAVINFGLLGRYGAKYDLVLIYPKKWSEGVSEAFRILRVLLTRFLFP
jgi:hypothetical protein